MSLMLNLKKLFILLHWVSVAAHELSSCGTHARLPCSKSDPSPLTKDQTVSLTLEAGLLTTGLSEKCP